MSGVAPTVIDELTEASSRSDSFSEALLVALSVLREELRSESVMLFEKFDISEPEYRFRAASPNGILEGVIPAVGFLLTRLRFCTSSLAFAPNEIDTVLTWALQQKTSYVSETEFLKRVGMRLAVPLRTKGQIIGLLLLGPPLGRDKYDPRDNDVVRVYSQHLTLMIENARLTDRVVEHEKLRRDMALAAEVQERLLPQKSLETPYASAAAFTMPARIVGGDCYDFLEFGQSAMGISLADVSGKGIPAALIMSAIQTCLRIIASEGHIAPVELTRKLNNFLYRSTDSCSYATFLYAEIDAERMRLRYVNAGHNPPYLVRLGGPPLPGQSLGVSIEELKTGGTVIGMFPDSDYEEGWTDLRSGDVIFAFTDGVTEALNSAEQEFGVDRLKIILGQAAHLSVKEIIAGLSQEVRNWIADTPQHDDLTLIVIKIT